MTHTCAFCLLLFLHGSAASSSIEPSCPSSHAAGCIGGSGMAGNEIECSANGDESCSADQTILLQAKVNIAAKTLTGDGDGNGTQLAAKSLEVGGQCEASCWDKTCDQWVQDGISCDELTGASWGCDCSGCHSCNQVPEPTPPPPPPPPPPKQPKCQDLPGAKSGKVWTDGADGCDSYGANGYCPEYGGKDYGEGKANDKCCVCGGGAPVTKKCQDLPGAKSGEAWTDGADGCASYEANGYCPEYGGKDYGEGKANDKCCACGGGTTGKVQMTTAAPSTTTAAPWTNAEQWVILSDGSGPFVQNIPEDASQKIVSLTNSGSRIASVSVTKGGGWTVLWGTNSFTCHKGPPAACQTLKDLKSQGRTLKSITYTANNGWVILFDRNGARMNDIPNDMARKLNSLAWSGVQITGVSFTAGGGWTVLWDKNQFACRNVPPEAFQKLEDLKSQGKSLKSVAYTSNDGWVILYDRSDHHSFNIPTDAKQKLESLRASGADITSVSFPPRLPLSVDRSWVINRMKSYNVRGLSLAVVKDGKIYAQGYGVTEDGGLSVDTTTHFQAGSISKPLSALGALTLVQQGQLDLDEDVNTRLKSWKYRKNRFTPWNGINLRQILSHTGGFVWHGSPGYKVGSPVPSLLQILDGVYPANTRPIEVAYPIGEYHYAGGGYMVMEQEIEDVTGSKFTDFMSSTVLGPLGMASSSFEQPAPSTILDGAAAGYEKGRLLDGKWYVYPEHAAASLWCTPSDLVKFVIHMRKAAEGEGIISADLRKQFLTIQPGGKTYGLGLEVAGQGASRYYYHGGSTDGYRAHMRGFTETSDGAVVMINGNRGGVGPIIFEVLNHIGKNFGWP